MSHPVLTVEFRKPEVFRFVWIKYVRGFDPTQHCAKCLVGENSKALKYGEIKDLKRVTLNEHHSPFIYICGVTEWYEWNLHIAGYWRDGELTQFEDDRVSVRIDNFHRVEISAVGNPPAPKEFALCRCWQFGWTAFSETPKPVKL
jgi:hypothetical protein